MLIIHQVFWWLWSCLSSEDASTFASSNGTKHSKKKQVRRNVGTFELLHAKNKLIDGIIKEPVGGAHNDPKAIAKSIKAKIKSDLAELMPM